MSIDTPTSRTITEQLNRDCFCVTLDTPGLETAMRADIDEVDFSGLMSARPHLFARAPVFLSKADRSAMISIVSAIEGAAQNPRFVETVLAYAPEIAMRDFGPSGAFMGYDFHVGADGPNLIEINTNAGGAFLNAFLARAQIACCAEIEHALALKALGDFEARVAAMFEAEWRAQGRMGQLRRIVIVDDAPQDQYLYPEFLLAQRLLERAGFEVEIADPRELSYERDQVGLNGRPVDLIYNRLVDFSLDEPGHEALRQAYVDDAVVITPNPRNHAFFADKRNLIVLSDPEASERMGIDHEARAALARIPDAQGVTSANAPQLWADRKHYFFKPASGHGGKAVYRGDNLTRGVWAAIVAGDYIAQTFAPPSERMIECDGVRAPRKLDVRLYTYRGEVLIAAARLYQGQTTNFRTPGGGFAPLFFV